MITMIKKKTNVLTKDEIVLKYKRMKKRRKIIGIFSFLLLCTGLMLWHFIQPIYKEVSNNVYSVFANMEDGLFTKSGNTVIYDKNDNVVGRIGNEKYEYVPISKISDYIQNGYIAKEDKNFTTHHGVDLLSTARAGVKLILNKGSITQGGSTITQQVVKNNLLTQEQTFIRKFSEIIIAVQVEKDYTKADIMEFYCNSNYYGNGCYGVEGACQYYYGKSAKDVSLAEAAMIVATSNSPNNYNPVANYETAMKQKDIVLEQMLACGYISEEERDAASKENPEIIRKSEKIDNDSYLISYAVHCAALDLMKNDGFEFRYTFHNEKEYENYEKIYDEKYNRAINAIRNNGYTIKTSLDQDLQKTLQQAISDGLSDYKAKNEDGIYKMQSAAVCVDNSTGMVSAIVGGRDEDGSFNRGYQAVRQPGSCIKPLLDYGPAINEGILTPGTVQNDKKTVVDGYSPQNATHAYRGAVSAREALVRSLNTTALQAFDKTGSETCFEYLDKMHFSTLTYSDMISPAVSIGGFSYGVTVADLAKGYATLANSGKYTDDDCIVSLIDHVGNVVYEKTNTMVEVYTEDTAFMITDMLEGMFQDSYGAGYDSDTDGQIYAGKTGSTDNRKDAWFCGYSKYYSTAVWIGYDYPRDLGFYGSSYPMEIWLSFMNEISKEKELAPAEFDIPSTISLINEFGSLKTPNYKSKIHQSRPAGWDYTSLLTLDKVAEQKAKDQESEAYQKAQKATEEFEEFQITNAVEAQELKTLYNDVCTLIEALTDPSHRAALSKRVAYKYDLLKNEVSEKWTQAIADLKLAQEAERDLNNKIAAQKSLEAAEKLSKDSKIELVQKYIDAIKERTVYTSIVEDLISNGEKALNACSSYSEYSELKSSFDSAVAYARSLPKPDASDSMVEDPSTHNSTSTDDEQYVPGNVSVLPSN